MTLEPYGMCQQGSGHAAGHAVHNEKCLGVRESGDVWQEMSQGPADTPTGPAFIPDRRGTVQGLEQSSDVRDLDFQRPPHGYNSHES